MNTMWHDMICPVVISIGVMSLASSGGVTLTDYEEIDGGYVAFGGNPKGGKITSRARTPQQNGVAERKNRTLIEAARTMLADSKLPTTFLAKAINIACYVQNMVLVTKPHNTTPYELFLGRKPALGFMKPFGCHVTILNSIDHLGKFDGKADEGFFIGYSINSKAFRVFNSRTRIVKENLHVQFSENTPNIAGSGPNWIFDIDALTKSMNYKPVVAGNQSNGNAGTKACDDAGKARMETKVDEDPRKDSESINQEKDDNVNNTNNVNAASTNEVNAVGGKTSIELPDDLNMPALEDIVYSNDDEDVGAEADMNNLDAFMPVSPIPNIRVHKDHLVEQIIRYLNSAPQTRRMTKNLKEQGLFSSVQQRTNHTEFKNCLFACFLSQEPKKMDVKSAFVYGKIEEEVYVCQPPGFEDPDFPDKVYMVEKALYGLHQAPKAWYETLSTYLLDNGFHRGKIDKTLFIRRDKGDILLVQVYVDDIIFGSIKKSLCTESEKMMHNKFQMSYMGELTFFLGLQVKQKEDGSFISQDNYVTEILKKFGFTDVKTASTPMETQKVLLNDEDVCACARYQVNPKVSHLHAVKRIFRYLKGQPKLGLWYPKDSPFDLVAYIDSDYTRKSTTGGCQFLISRLISWQCKKQNVVANSTPEAEYVAASSCYGQVLWIQNQLLDYGDCNEKKLIHMFKIHTDKNVADLLTKAFDRVFGLELKVYAARHNLLLMLKVNDARHKLTTAVES
ncbi:putative ribonuclease H-like domain-containing protein [Tanacetum coccineum]